MRKCSIKQQELEIPEFVERIDIYLADEVINLPMDLLEGLGDSYLSDRLRNLNLDLMRFFGEDKIESAHIKEIFAWEPGKKIGQCKTGAKILKDLKQYLKAIQRGIKKRGR